MVLRAVNQLMTGEPTSVPALSVHGVNSATILDAKKINNNSRVKLKSKFFCFR